MELDSERGSGISRVRELRLLGGATCSHFNWEWSRWGGTWKLLPSIVLPFPSHSFPFNQNPNFRTGKDRQSNLSILQMGKLRLGEAMTSRHIIPCPRPEVLIVLTFPSEPKLPRLVLGAGCDRTGCPGLGRGGTQLRPVPQPSLTLLPQCIAYVLRRPEAAATPSSPSGPPPRHGWLPERNGLCDGGGGFQHPRPAGGAHSGGLTGHHGEGLGVGVGPLFSQQAQLPPRALIWFFSLIWYSILAVCKRTAHFICKFLVLAPILPLLCPPLS